MIPIQKGISPSTTIRLQKKVTNFKNAIDPLKPDRNSLENCSLS